ncbi:hypothetical protein NDU88_001665 [Pleurodeles waltl]|uniref:Uncharacterized protein n=1 Tax=Pleurodeles waltl TaxID=8319 RepID=A0AAV7RBX0_PLEWA|nr:hypothetical protein NDU88_001665 [Pleurodeles waltl]
MPAPRHSWGARWCGKAHRGHQPKEARLCTRSHSCRRPGLAGAPAITAIISRLVTQRAPRRGHWKRKPSAGGARAGIFRLGPHPCTRPHSCRRPGTAGAPAGAVKHIEAINLKRPAFALDHIHAGAPAWPRPLETQAFRWWRSGRNLPARAPPLHSPAFMPAPRHSWGARWCGKAHRGHQPKEARLCTRSHSCRRPGLAGAPAITAIISRLVTQRAPRR